MSPSLMRSVRSKCLEETHFFISIDDITREMSVAPPDSRKLKSAPRYARSSRTNSSISPRVYERVTCGTRLVISVVFFKLTPSTQRVTLPKNITHTSVIQAAPNMTQNNSKVVRYFILKFGNTREHLYKSRFKSIYKLK